MKKVTNYFLRIIMVFIAIVALISASASNPTITINYNVSGLTPGASIIVPLVIDGGSNNILGFDLDINYNTDILTYTSFSDEYPSLAPLFACNFVNQTTYKIRATWSGFSSLTLTNQVICNLHFTYNGGSTPLTLVLSGPLNNPGNSYIIDDNFNYLSATWNNGSASGSASVITSVAGGGNWSTAATWDLGHVPNSSNTVVIASPPASPVSITANATDYFNLTINAGGALTLNSGQTLTVNGNFLIKSDVSGSGSFVDLGGTLTVSGTTAVQRYMAGNWTSGIPTVSTIEHEISSPVSGGIIDTFIGDLLSSWNEPTQVWDSYTLPLGQLLVVGKGYAAAPHIPGGVRTFSGGTLNTGDLFIGGLTSTGGPTYTGYNLIGNPYPSALLFNGWSTTNLETTVWVWNPSGSGNYLTGKAVGNTLPGNIIPAENGFFVHVTSGSGSVTIPNAKRQHSTQTFYKDAVPNMLYLTASGNGYSDMMSVYFDPAAAPGFDPLDGSKMWGLTAAPQLYSILNDNTNVTINALPDISSTKSVNLGFKVGVATDYVITASELSSFNGTVIYLEDKRDSKTVNLMETPAYSFNAAPGDPIQRFTLHFNAVGIPEIGSGKINIYSNLKDVYVNIPVSMHGNIFVYNLLGSEITNQVIEGNSLNRISLNTPTGYYIVKVIGDDGITTGKVYIQ